MEVCRLPDFLTHVAVGAGMRSKQAQEARWLLASQAGQLSQKTQGGDGQNAQAAAQAS